ncbi:unnamed protein product [Peronospora belbahrii]|uniref:Uncharacterized protein n=1 Tax=Peronospora belbahrii TaxID=622444 RepID=A0AAU9KZA0_9STRA|nr:unnamed protein product [Peronospora belbahrii]CAH0516721.1 unnamed protein product [Peronospora belbahrii]
MPGKKRAFDVSVRDGPTYWWAFQKDEEVSDNMEIKEYPYRLHEQWRLTVWIKEFCEDDTANVMVCLLKTPPDLLVKLTVAYGNCASCSSQYAVRVQLSRGQSYKTFAKVTTFCRAGPIAVDECRLLS